MADSMRRFIDAPTRVCTMGKKSTEIAREKYDVQKVNTAMLQIMGLD